MWSHCITKEAGKCLLHCYGLPFLRTKDKTDIAGTVTNLCCIGNLSSISVYSSINQRWQKMLDANTIQRNWAGGMHSQCMKCFQCDKMYVLFKMTLWKWVIYFLMNSEWDWKPVTWWITDGTQLAPEDSTTAQEQVILETGKTFQGKKEHWVPQP